MLLKVVRTLSYLLKIKLTFTQSFARGGVFDITEKEVFDGRIKLVISGQNALESFKNEIGGHRWQRVPPTEKRDRVHTSTVTVTVVEESSTKPQRITLNKKDVEEKFMRGSGKGGQHRNKTDTACQIKHIPTGIIVRSENERSQAANRENAWKELERRLQQQLNDDVLREGSKTRLSQAGSGQRGDKRRTYRDQDDSVVDNVTGKRATLSRIIKGEIELLW